MNKSIRHIAHIGHSKTSLTAVLTATEIGKSKVELMSAPVENIITEGNSRKEFLMIKGNISPDQLEKFRTDWEAAISGVGNAHKVPILQGDIEWINIPTYDHPSLGRQMLEVKKNKAFVKRLKSRIWLTIKYGKTHIRTI